jgi:hypothetical protein
MFLMMGPTMTDEQHPAAPVDQAPKSGGRLKARQKTYITWLITVPAIISATIALLIVLSDKNIDSERDVFEDLLSGAATLDFTIGLVIAAIIAIGIPTTFYKWHKSIDEQEEKAVLWANTISLYFGLVLWLAWWVLAATKRVPPVDLMTVALVTAVVSLAYWAWKKFL